MTISVTDILNQFRANNGEANVHVSFSDGTVQTLQLTACMPYGKEPDSITDQNSIEYVLSSGACWAAWLGGDGSQLENLLQRIPAARQEWQNQAVALKQFYEAHKNDWTGDESYDFYSDWHKDVFGYRPRGWNYDPLHNAF